MKVAESYQLTNGKLPPDIVKAVHYMWHFTIDSLILIYAQALVKLSWKFTSIFAHKSKDYFKIHIHLFLLKKINFLTQNAAPMRANKCFISRFIGKKIK